MAALMPQGKQQYFTAGGIPLVGGKVYTYAAGTTTPLATYTTAAASTPNANPVILDSRGEASIFFSAANYKIVVKDSLDSTIWTQDNLPGDQAATILANLAASTGSSLVGHIASGAGAVATTVQVKLRERVSVKDFGAVGDGVTDDTAAIQGAMNASSGKTLDFLDGFTYLISAEIAGVSNVEIVGHSTIKAVTRIRSYLYFGAKTNIRITGLLFDLGQSVLPTYTSGDYAAAVYAGSNYNQAVYCYQSSKIYIRDCQVSNLYTSGMMFYQCTDVIDVIGNRSESPLQVQGVNSVHLQFQTCSAWITVQNNKFRNANPTTGPAFGVAGVYTSGLSGTLDVSNNLFLYCGRDSTGGHQLGAYSSYGDVAQGVIRNNVFLSSLQQVIRLTLCHHMDVHDNYCTMSSFAGAEDQMVSIEGSTTLGVAPFGCDDIKVHHNTFIDDYSAQRVGVYAGAYDWGYPLKDITISDNLFLGMKRSVAITGPYHRVRIERNNSLGANGNIIGYDINTITPTATHGLQVNAVMKDLSIQGNITESTAGSTSPLNLIFTGFTGAIQEVTVSDNRFVSGIPNAASAFAYRGIASGDLVVKNNYILGFALPFDLVNGSTLVLSNNTCRSWTAALPYSLSGFTTLNTFDNSYSTGASAGVARLVAGTVTVATPEVLTGDLIFLSRAGVDGSTMGHLSQPTITSKTSFVIQSSSGTESNFVNWEIVH